MPDVKAAQPFLVIAVTILKMNAINTTIICGIANRIAIAVPIAVPNPPHVWISALAAAYVDDKYDIKYSRYNAVITREISANILDAFLTGLLDFRYSNLWCYYRFP